MGKLIKSNNGYYEYEHQYHQWFKKISEKNGVLMFMSDDYDYCIICDNELNILHEIGVNNNTSLLEYKI